MLRGIEEMEMQEAMQEARQGSRIFTMHCENFAIPAKILLCTVFRCDSEISLS